MIAKELKALLIKDLCARLPYNVKCKDVTLDFVGTMTDISRHDNMCKLYNDYGDNYTCFMMNCKPYLFPLSSMTEEQEYQYREVIASSLNHYEVYDWFNKNHFDYRGLIEKSLALDATGLNIY